MGDVKQCAWCGAKTRSECKGGTECQQDVSGPGWGCMDHIHPTTDAVINVLSHVTGQPKLAIADRELEIAAEQVCGLEDQLAALREEPVAYMRNEGTPNNLVKCTFTCPDAFGVYRQPAPVSVVLPEYKVEDRDDNFPEGWNACLDKVKELNQ